MRKASALQLVLLALAIHWQIDSITTTNIICGQRPIAAPGTITYGRSSWPGQFPWHVALYRTEQPLTISYACGGFIVGERVVITAAHCVTAPSGYQLAADELTVRVGLYDLFTLARHSQEHRVGRIHRHGNFTTGSPRHDLALLMLRTIVEFGDFVQPILCQSYRDQCPKQEDVSYLAPIVRPIRVAGSSPRYARLVIDCYGVLISERFLLAPASCHHSTEDDLREERTHQSNIALIELERAVSLSTCQFVCLWTGVEGAESETLPNILLYSAVNVSSGDKSIESSEMTVRPTSSGRSSTTQASRCYDELLAPLVMQQNPDGGRSDRLVGIVVERTCTTIRFIKVAPFLGWIERIVWRGSSSSDNDNGQ
uniref:Peptidase S1 domain-containing protein n=1 Tax=Anopheles melas TaxID=34690 RepID=A0A182TU50_9DIPT